MTGLAQIDQVRVPESCIEFVYRHLRAVGRRGVEGVALWAGQRSATRFDVLTTLIPAQYADRVEEGLFYAVDGEEIHRINTWLYHHNQTLIAQLHSHPGEAYHSEMDDLYPIVAATGSLSIVIPDFGFNEPSIEEWAVYRLDAAGTWNLLPLSITKKLIELIP